MEETIKKKEAQKSIRNVFVWRVEIGILPLMVNDSNKSCTKLEKYAEVSTFDVLAGLEDELVVMFPVDAGHLDVLRVREKKKKRKVIQDLQG